MSEPREILAPFEQLDFQALWKGREAVSRTEAEALLALLSAAGRQRILEAGCGDGRLSRVIRQVAREYVATDLVPSFLARLPAEVTAPASSLRVVSNLYHLPFRDASFDTAVLFRVYNFLSAPARALRELGRVLTPGGVLIVTVHTRPSVATLVDDTRLFLGKVPGATMRPTTFRSGGPARGVSGLPTWLPTREDVRRLFESSGFRVDSEHPLGLEDFRPFSWWPRRSLQKFSDWTQGLDLAPFRLYRLRGPGSIAEALRPGLGSILSCPKCRAPFPSVDMSKPPDALRCGSCGSSWGVQERMLDLRFDPEAIPPSP